MKLPVSNKSFTPMTMVANHEAGAQPKDLSNTESTHASVTSKKVSLADLGKDILDSIIAQLQKNASSHLSPDISRLMTAIRGSKALYGVSLDALRDRLIPVHMAINAICSPTQRTNDAMRSIAKLEPNLRLTPKLCHTLHHIQERAEYLNYKAGPALKSYDNKSWFNLHKLSQLIYRFGRSDGGGEPFVSALFWAVKASSSFAIITQLIAQGEDPVFVDNSNYSLLVHAADVGDPRDLHRTRGSSLGTGSLDKVKALTAGMAMAADNISLEVFHAALRKSRVRMELMSEGSPGVSRETLNRWLPTQKEIVLYLETITREVECKWRQNHLPALRHLSFAAFINPYFEEGHEENHPDVPQDYVQKIDYYLAEGIDFNAEIEVPISPLSILPQIMMQTQMQPLEKINFLDLQRLHLTHNLLPFESNVTALGCAALNGQPLLVQALLDRGATPHGPAFGPNPVSVLCHAACADAGLADGLAFGIPLTKGSVGLLAVFLESSNDLGLTREHVEMALVVAQRWRQMVLKTGWEAPDFAAKQGVIISYLQTKLKDLAQ